MNPHDSFEASNVIAIIPLLHGINLQNTPAVYV